MVAEHLAAAGMTRVLERDRRFRLRFNSEAERPTYMVREERPRAA